MQLLYIVPAGAQASQARYRAYPFVQAGKARGLDICIREAPFNPFKRYAFFSRLPKAETIIVHRALLSRYELMTVKRLCGRLVYDLADAVWTMPDALKGTPRSAVREARYARRAARLCEHSDLCLVDNRQQADAVRQWQDEVVVLPTPIDIRRYAPGDGGNQSGIPLVGWMGSRFNESFLETVLSRLTNHMDAMQFSVVSGSEYTGPAKERVLWTAWREEREPVQLQAMDVGIVPKEPDPYHRQDNGIELLRMMASGMAVVASDVGCHRDVMEHGVEGYLARERGDWEKYVVRLVEDVSLRQRMATAARKRVETCFDLEDAAGTLWRVLGF